MFYIVLPKPIPYLKLPLHGVHQPRRVHSHTMRSKGDGWMTIRPCPVIGIFGIHQNAIGHTSIVTMPDIPKGRTCQLSLMDGWNCWWVMVYWYCWWFRHPINSPVEVGSLSYYFEGFVHRRWCRISEPSTVWMDEVVYGGGMDGGMWWWMVDGWYMWKKCWGMSSASNSFRCWNKNMAGKSPWKIWRSQHDNHERNVSPEIDAHP